MKGLGMVRYRLGLVVSLLTCGLKSTSQEFQWMRAEERIRDAVVQVRTQATIFNWIHPYRSPEQSQYIGSGFFIDTNGHLLTTYQVVNDAKSIYVTVPSMGQVPLAAEVVGVCPELDVALLVLTKESKQLVEKACGSINALELGDSDALYEAQSVLALGYPLGFRSLKSTVGCVAGRDFLHGCSLIHITAPINPGNYGGPSVDQEGRVIGIKTGHWAGTQNYNYIVPSNDVLVILPDLYKKGLVRRPSAGLEGNRTTELHARSLNNPVPAGLYVNYVYKDSMGEKAGIKAGDILYEVEFNGVRYTIDEFGDVVVPWRLNDKISVRELLVRCRTGDPLAVVVYRKGTKHKLTGVFESPKLGSVRTIYPEFEPHEIDYEMFGGLVIMQLRANHLDIILESRFSSLLKELYEYKYLENRSKAVLVVTSVLPGSLAHLSDCFVPGYLLDSVNGRKVTSLKELRDALHLSVKTGEIVLSTQDHPSTVFRLDEMLSEEPKLSRDFVYQITPTIKNLMKALEKKAP